MDNARKNTNLLDINNNEVYVGDVFEIESDDIRIVNKFTRTVKEINGKFYLVDSMNYGEELEVALDLNSDRSGIAKSLKNIGFKYSKVIQKN
jgi:TusA-related sulfurtransferase